MSSYQAHKGRLNAVTLIATGDAFADWLDLSRWAYGYIHCKGPALGVSDGPNVRCTFGGTAPSASFSAWDGIVGGNGIGLYHGSLPGAEFASGILNQACEQGAAACDAVADQGQALGIAVDSAATQALRAGQQRFEDVCYSTSPPLCPALGPIGRTAEEYCWEVLERGGTVLIPCDWFNGPVQTAGGDWEDVYDDCMRRQIEKNRNPVESFWHVVSGAIFWDVAHCIGVASGWWTDST